MCGVHPHARKKLSFIKWSWMNTKNYWIRQRLVDLCHRTIALIFLYALPSHAFCLDLFTAAKPGEAGVVILKIEEPFIEMHTGPGRGYPVFNVVEHGETIEILARKTNWYKVRSMDKKTGWTKAEQLAHTLKPTGVPVDLPEVGHGDYLKSSSRVGFTMGELDGASSYSLTAGYRTFTWAGVELEVGKVFDESVTSGYYGVNIHVEPMPDWTVTPFISAGLGRFSFDTRQKVLVDAVGSTSYTGYGAGANYYIGRNFVVLGEYRRYSVSSTNNSKVGLNAWRIGLSAFF